VRDFEVAIFLHAGGFDAFDTQFQLGLHVLDPAIGAERVCTGQGKRSVLASLFLGVILAAN
jgi:hypothetical protein